jgi:hypothetical protein
MAISMLAKTDLAAFELTRNALKIVRDPSRFAFEILGI